MPFDWYSHDKANIDGQQKPPRSKVAVTLLILGILLLLLFLWWMYQGIVETT